MRHPYRAKSIFSTAANIAELSELSVGRMPPLQAGDANQDLSFDQFDIIEVLRAGKYLTSEVADWHEGDWNGAPGGRVGLPPAGDGVFNQLDLIEALRAGRYQQGRDAAKTIVVPEPSGVFLILAGILGLIVAAPSRTRRACRNSWPAFVFNAIPAYKSAQLRVEIPIPVVIEPRLVVESSPSESVGIGESG